MAISSGAVEMIHRPSIVQRPDASRVVKAAAATRCEVVRGRGDDLDGVPGPAIAFDPDAPLRLKVAADVAFPDGSMTASGLRREADRGRLVIERIAGKLYTTLAEIERMRTLCRVEARVPAFGSVPQDATRQAKLLHGRFGSSSMPGGTSPQDALRAKLSELSRS